MSVLRIYLFGSVRIVHDGRPAEVNVTRIVQALLAYLLLQRHRCHSREVLTGLLWGDHREDRAHGCLNTALWRLRRVLEPEGIPRGTYLMTTPAGEVGFNRERDYWLDVEVFEAQVGQVLAQPFTAMEAADVEELEQTLQLYSGDLLEGFYDNWALREQERLRCLYLNSLAHCMYYYRHHGAYEESLACGQQILNRDPLREEIHRDMMRLYLDAGRRALAVRQYETCHAILATELGIPPMEETQALYAQIAPLAGHHRRQSPVAAEVTTLQQALQQLGKAMQACDKAREQVQRAIQLVEGFTEGRNHGSVDAE
jgi:DNA-binding SARP family transcriptional activator